MRNNLIFTRNPFRILEPGDGFYNHGSGEGSAPGKGDENGGHLGYGRQQDDGEKGDGRVEQNKTI